MTLTGGLIAFGTGVRSTCIGLAGCIGSLAALEPGMARMNGLLADVDARPIKKAILDPSRAVMRLVLRSRLSRLSRLNVAEERARLLTFLSRHFAVDAPILAAEFDRSEFRRWFQERRAALQRFTGPMRLGTTGAFGCEALYLLVRAARPQVVIDTGVLYGGSSAHILAALAQNGTGRLYSIDIGRDPREPPHDFFIRDDLRPHWELIIGDSRHELPSLLRRLPAVDMFHHDSLHTFEHMTWEFETVFPHLSPSGVLSSDDVINPSSLIGIFQQNAFPAFCQQRQVLYAQFHNFGVGLPGDRRAERFSS
jgi:predicted O-methyltransferase YrrM